MRDPSGTSRGFAFLTFEDADAVNAVVVHEHFLDGKAIDPKRAIPREEHLRNTRYFVGGLAATSTSESMREFFTAYGKVVDATVMVDRESGRSKGFGFVTFEDASNADQLVGKNGLILDDKQIEVKMAQPRSQRDQARTAAPLVNNRDSTFNDRGSALASPNMTFPVQQANPMSMIYQQRPMGQVPMMAGNMQMMGMNPMAMAIGMGMNGFNPMGGMNAMSMMNGMNPMGAMNGMGNIGTMRLGMGPMGANGLGQGNPVMVGMNPIGMGMRPGVTGMGGALNPINRLAMNVGPGPARLTSRGQHNFHPYSR
ncbi:hypothetical protein BDZ94DRAFT_1266031 [Collybia nuda]|uniref:RRM domain-containing protein n=1 Tax=Collybia nuda TaxID=64659 RepID=A0A9P5Y1B1_9AGAR|nr:hypothetical protein BDZ94DRAFT_1266031 [Collybia nuda]